MLEPIRELLDAGIQSDRNDRDESWAVMVREQLDTAEVELSSVLASRRMSLRELTKLKIGDILPIDMPKQVPLCVEGIPVFTGEFGVANDRNAIKIIATHPPGKRPNVPVIQETSNE
jgi:flagellar motor switch protein FliM